MSQYHKWLPCMSGSADSKTARGLTICHWGEFEDSVQGTLQVWQVICDKAVRRVNFLCCAEWQTAFCSLCGMCSNDNATILGIGGRVKSNQSWFLSSIRFSFVCPCPIVTRTIRVIQKYTSLYKYVMHCSSWMTRLSRLWCCSTPTQKNHVNWNRFYIFRSEK